MSRSKRIGTAAETAVVNFLKQFFPHCERRAGNGFFDRGDITGIDPNVVIEVKACREMDLGGWFKELEVEMKNANATIGMVWHKRRMKADPGDWYVSMPGHVALELLKEYTA